MTRNIDYDGYLTIAAARHLSDLERRRERLYTSLMRTEDAMAKIKFCPHGFDLSRGGNCLNCKEGQS